MTLAIFVVFLKTPAPGLTWSHKNPKCNQSSGLCREAWKSAHSKGTKVSRKRNHLTWGVCVCVCVYFLTLRYTLPLPLPPVRVTRRTVGQFAQQGDGDVWRGQAALPADSKRPWLRFMQKGLILQYRETCSQTNHLVQRQCQWEEKLHLQAFLWKGNKNLVSTPYLRKIRFAQQLSWGRDLCYSLRAVLTKDNGEGASPTKHKQ